MNILLVYASFHHGNTKTIAHAMAETLGARLQPVQETSAADIAASDAVGFGSGIYFWRHHRSLFRLLDTVAAPAHKRAWIFSTGGIVFPRFHPFHLPLRRQLAAKGFTVCGEFSCRGLDTVGPLRLIGGINRGHPSQEDIGRARKFAEHLQGVLNV
jgi:flavodoxin